MSTSPLRAGMVPVTRQMRAYFAPGTCTTETPTIFDPAESERSRWARRQPMARSGMDRKLQRAITTRRRIWCESGARGIAGGAVSRAPGRRESNSILGMGQTADGTGGRIGAHECAGDRRREARRPFGRNADPEWRCCRDRQPASWFWAWRWRRFAVGSLLRWMSTINNRLDMWDRGFRRLM